MYFYIYLNVIFFSDENGDYFVKLKELIEETYDMNGNSPVLILAHSMGGPMSLHFLHTQSRSWKQKYIRALVTLSGAWGGSVKALKVFLVGKFIPYLLPLYKLLYTNQGYISYTQKDQCTRDVHRVSFPFIPQPVNHLLHEATACA